MHLDHKLLLTPHTAMRKGDFKLIWDWHGKLELYKIVKDPYEGADLLEQLPERTHAMFKEQCHLMLISICVTRRTTSGVQFTLAHRNVSESLLRFRL